MSLRQQPAQAQLLFVFSFFLSERAREIPYFSLTPSPTPLPYPFEAARGGSGSFSPSLLQRLHNRLDDSSGCILFSLLACFQTVIILKIKHRIYYAPPLYHILWMAATDKAKKGSFHKSPLCHLLFTAKRLPCFVPHVILSEAKNLYSY